MVSFLPSADSQTLGGGRRIVDLVAIDIKTRQIVYYSAKRKAKSRLKDIADMKFNNRNVIQSECENN
ncbi:MAG: hypothetical protein LVQ96_04200 [Thermoplasmatales archaeon]|nr:hypothetical protein [Thermoplasmatales archaeon]MCW6170356.1 hypothetical protein [Thermoplasmatales archaeon]